jgi:predicted CxxxxCH...CXXCH cytochrome family protein
MKNITLFSILVLVFSLAFFSCAEVEENIPTQTELPGIHPKGFGSPGSPSFHTAKFAATNWDLKPCQSCHGASYSGGTTGSNCLDCHTKPTGPEACNTCHGVFANSSRIAPPTDLLGNVSTSEKGVGAHAAHLYDTKISNSVACFECHPGNPAGEDKFVFNHIDGIPAEMQFASFSSGAVATPTYDFGNLTCANTYCHGNFSFEKASSQNQFAYTEDFMTGNNYSPIWNKVEDTQAACGTCHGQYDNDNNLISLAPVGHIPVPTCNGCHGQVVDADNNIIDPTRHINKQIDFGN